MKHLKNRPLAMLAMATLAALLLWSCGEAAAPLDQIGLSGGVQGQCENFDARSVGADPMDQLIGEVSIEVTHNWAKVVHSNVVYNCAAQIRFELEVQGSTLVITEMDDSTQQADCLCPIDLEVQVVNLACNTTYGVQLFNEDHTLMFANKTFKTNACPDDTWQCVTAQDCYDQNIVHPECVGGFQCQQNQCAWVCENSLDCQTDSDCPYGYYCLISDDITWMEGDQTNAMYAPAQGVCEPFSVQCTTDYDCNVYWTGVEGSDDNAVAAPCNGQWQCVAGQCEYACVEQQCQSNNDCASGQICVFYDFLSYGLCENQVEPQYCMDDAECGAGYHCEFVDYAMTNADGTTACTDANTDPATGCMPPSYYGICVEDQNNGQCFSDADCTEGYICQYYWDDTVSPDCYNENGEDSCIGMPAPEGWCVPANYPVECYGDADCPSGYECDLSALVDGVYVGEEHCGIGSDGQVYCVSAGVCVPASNECWSDYDCAVGQYCVLPPSTPCEPDAAGNCGETYPVGPGWCEDDPTTIYCQTDVDCPAGFYCVANMIWCDDSQGDCGAPLGVCVRGTEPVPCNAAADCAVGEICIEGLCVSASHQCGSNAACDAGYVCMDGVCVIGTDPVACAADADCAMGQVCDASTGLCVGAEPVWCRDDASCPAGQVCDASTGLCVVEPIPDYCHVDRDCPTGMVCLWDSTTGETGVGRCYSGDPNQDLPCAADVDCPSYMACYNGLCQYLLD